MRDDIAVITAGLASPLTVTARRCCSFACSLGALAITLGHALACAPGQVGCRADSPIPHSEFRAQAQDATGGQSCDIVGDWLDDAGGVYAISSDLTGSVTYSYCPGPFPFTVTLGASNNFSVSATAPASPLCQNFVLTMSFGPQCTTASGSYVNADGTSGSETWTLQGGEIAAVSADDPTIPSDSRVMAGHVLTHSDLTVTVTNSGTPVPGVAVTLTSDRAATIDTVTQPTDPTDSSGTASGDIETRFQPGPSTTKATGSGITSSTPATITWFPADFDQQFLVTCYVLAVESTFAPKPQVSNVPGLPPSNSYSSQFINDVRVQGSGQANDGSIVHYNGSGIYSLQSCALTAVGVCAVDGTTAAVDRTVLPKRSSFTIDGTGPWLGQDTGGAIKGYHIDEYYGTRRAACLATGHPYLDVTFNSY